MVDFFFISTIEPRKYIYLYCSYFYYSKSKSSTRRYISASVRRLFYLADCTEKVKTQKHSFDIYLYRYSSEMIYLRLYVVRRTMRSCGISLTLEVLHSHVADVSDEFLPLEPVIPLVPSHQDQWQVPTPRKEYTERKANRRSIVQLVDREPFNPSCTG